MSPPAEVPRLLLPMLCPGCGAALDAGPGDRVGTCAPCASAYFLGSELERYPLLFACPEGLLAQRGQNLPFWRIRAAWTVAAEPKKARLYGGLGTSGDLFFPAFWRPRMTYFEDLTWRYLRLPKALPCERGDGPLRGGVRPPGVVREMGRLSVLSYMDRVADIDGVELRFEVLSQEFVGIPFLRTESGWTDAVCGLRFPPSLFPG